MTESVVVVFSLVSDSTPITGDAEAFFSARVSCRWEGGVVAGFYPRGITSRGGCQTVEFSFNPFKDRKGGFRILFQPSNCIAQFTDFIV